MNKRVLCIIMILLISFAVYGCETQQMFSFSSKNKLVKKPSKAKYLISNDLGIKNIQDTLETEKGAVAYSYFEITGLKSPKVQEKLNKSIHSNVEKEINCYTSELSQKINDFYCSIDFNANNILSINAYGFEDPVFSLLYRLSDGKKLSLKDIFTNGTDYVSLLNRKITLSLLNGEKSDEQVLREPFSSIKPDQDFSLSLSKLYIIFRKGESGFAERCAIGIPLSEIDDYIDILDKYTPQYESEKLPDSIVKYNNIFSDSIGQIIKKANPRVLAYYPVISGLRNASFEKTINTTITSEITKIADNLKIKNMRIPAETIDPHISIDTNVIFNHYGILSFGTYVYSNYGDLYQQDFNRVYSFDLTSNKLVNNNDIIKRYAEKHTDFEEGLVNCIKDSLVSQYAAADAYLTNKINTKINFSYILNNCSVYFSNSFFQNDPVIIIHFNEKFSKEFNYPLECQFSLKKVLKSSLHDFFECRLD